jgi:hypothetical protein
MLGVSPILAVCAKIQASIQHGRCPTASQHFEVTGAAFCRVITILATQFQARLLEEQGFRDTVALLQAGQAQLRTHMRARQAATLQRSMAQCLQASRAQAVRVRRIERLKRFLDHSRGFMGADPQVMLDAAFLSPRQGTVGDDSTSPARPASSDRAKAAGCGAVEEAEDDKRNATTAEGREVPNGLVKAMNNAPDEATPNLQALLTPCDNADTHAAPPGNSTPGMHSATLPLPAHVQVCIVHLCRPMSSTMDAGHAVSRSASNLVFLLPLT